MNGVAISLLRFWHGPGAWIPIGLSGVWVVWNLIRIFVVECRAGVSPREALEALDQGSLTLPHATELLEKYRELRTILQDLGNLSLSGIVDSLLPAESDECSVLREVALFAVPELRDIGALCDLIKTHVSQPEMPKEGDFVRVMSLHKAKGLTSRVVIVAGCIQGLIPVQKRDESAVEQALILKEQRRLFYVAITRCTEIQVLSSAAGMERQLAWKIGAQLQSGRSNFGTTIASQFFDELGPIAPSPRSGHEWARAGYAP